MDEDPSAVTLSGSALTDPRKLVITDLTYVTGISSSSSWPPTNMLMDEDNDHTGIEEVVPLHEPNRHGTTDDPVVAVAENEKAIRRSLTFFGLPGEIRNQIYDLVVPANDSSTYIVDHITCRFLPGFAFVNRQMRAELLPLYILRRDWDFGFDSTEGISGIKDWVQSMKPYIDLMESFWVNIKCQGPRDCNAGWIEFEFSKGRVKKRHEPSPNGTGLYRPFVFLERSRIMYTIVESRAKELHQMHWKGILTVDAWVDAMESLFHIHPLLLGKGFE